ncbi:MAG: metallophosphoesterase [Candidatus Ozemobacteraceae bacterium]
MKQFLIAVMCVLISVCTLPPVHAAAWLSEHEQIAFSPFDTSTGPVALVSDLEGDNVRFQKLLREHPAFLSGDDGIPHLRPGASFVFCGDAPDRFPGERALLRELLRLKQEAPDRVILIVGNRDVNKLRLPPELSTAGLARRPWLYSREYAEWRAHCGLPDQAISRLRWILEQTMSAPKAFENRRQELASERNVPSDAIDDNAILESYILDARPGGLFYQYLHAAHIMERHGSTLFLHAGIPLSALGYIPGSPVRAPTVDIWIKRLEAWYQAQLDDWDQNESHWDGNSPEPADALLCYAKRWVDESMNPFSVMYGRNVDVEGKISLPSPPVIQWLRRSGICRLVVGHTPSGQIPVSLRTDDGSFEELVLDTSYGLPNEIPLVTLEGPDLLTTSIAATVEIQGVGLTPIAFRMPLGTNSPLGHQQKDLGILVAPLSTGWLSYRLGPGFSIKYEVQPFPVLER